MSKIVITQAKLKRLLYNAHMAGQGVESAVAWELAEKYADEQIKYFECPSRHVNQFRRPDDHIECKDCGKVW